MAAQQTLDGGDSGGGGGFMADIDTSAPFESVKEAVVRFGGLGFWKPNLHNAAKPSSHFLSGFKLEEIDVAKVEEQAVELEKELKLKEKDTLEILKELEASKMIVEELKSKLRTEELAMQLNLNANFEKGGEEEVDKENDPNLSQQKLPESLNTLPSSSPGLILLDLKQAKLNLSRTTNDLAEIGTSVEFYNKKIERERIALEKTRERLRSNSGKVSSLEEEIDRTRSKLQEAKHCSANDDFTTELRRLCCEAEQFKKMGETANSEVTRVMVEIDQTKAKIKTAEITLIAARKMNEAARASEAVALAEIKALEKSKNLCSDNPENVNLTLEDYSLLKSKAREAEESCEMKVIEAMLQVELANVSKMDIMKKVEEAMDEVKTSRQALEEALGIAENANSAKLAIEEALRKWRSDHGEKRRSIQNLTKFKNPCSTHRRRDSRMIDLNGINLVSEEAPTPLSIGQILSRKLLVTEEYESGKSFAKWKVSLGQMLGKQNADLTAAWKMEKDTNGPNKVPSKRKKLGFSRFSVILNKQSKKNKKVTSTVRLRFLRGGCRGEPQVKQLVALLKMFFDWPQSQLDAFHLA